jgi:poly-gamma-glutamate capsule biosynthesis protein CapA/YwtB (metallophosphatase superfamily)
MKLLFLGDIMFGRNNNKFIDNPFKYIEKYIKSVDVIIFNLETVISPIPLSDLFKTDKVFNYQSDGTQLITLRKMTDKLIIASTANNHSLDYDKQGILNTKKFLRNNNINYATKTYLETDKIIFFSYSDHCGCNNLDYWGNYINILDYKNTDKIIHTINLLKSKNKLIVFSIHWGSNWLDKMPKHMIRFGRLLIDNGVDIVFGHSVHHIPPVPYEIYKDKLIIYGLGDAINDYRVKKKYNSDTALMALTKVSKKNNLTNIDIIPIKRYFEDSSSIPKPI